ncbi:MAG: hypothetical protein ACYC6F_06725 [Longimicrobiales bacterium]
MFRSSFASSLLPLAAFLVGLALSPPPASAQGGQLPLTRTQFGVGYVANAPDAMAGGSAYLILPRGGGIGLYVDAKFDLSSPVHERGWDPALTSQEVADKAGSSFVQTEGSWKSFNVAVVRPLTPGFMIYAGGGFAKLRRFDLYNVDPFSDVGVGGVAWAENPATSETRTNLMAGIMMRLTRWTTAQFGYETQPDGVTAGVSIRLPPW